MKNIVILGFMGTGKTTIANKLAEETGMRYVSTDEMVEKREEAPISEIFDKRGEPYFRDVEKKVVCKVSQLDDVIIDAGGGVVKDMENIRNLRKKGVLVCLWADPRDIYDRTKFYEHRPLLNVKDPLKKIKELLEERKSSYELADYHVNTSTVTLEEAVESILRFVRQK